jgi:mycothiol system anti-sigma-R factor
MFERPGANQPSASQPSANQRSPLGPVVAPGMGPPGMGASGMGLGTSGFGAATPSVSDCNQTLSDMYTFIDGELPASFDQVVRAHLDGCTDCLGAFAFHVELRDLVMRKAATEHLPPGLAERIRRCFGD